MSSSCCGTKKQKLNGTYTASNGYNSTSSASLSGRESNIEESAANNHNCNGRIGGGQYSTSPGSSSAGHNDHSSNAAGYMPYGHSGPMNEHKMMANSMPEMCFYCFEILYRTLHNLEEPRTPTFSNDPYPLFVTWKIGKEKRLRGCIGTFSALRLHSGLREYAITSALRDSRFSPITSDEIQRLTVSVSILQGFEEARTYLDWTLGIHGIRIEFYNERGSKRSATYLPQVALEQGWDKTQTIDSLLRKGGYRPQITPETRRTIKVTRYTSQEWHMSYNEYHELLEKQSHNHTHVLGKMQC